MIVAARMVIVSEPVDLPSEREHGVVAFALRTAAFAGYSSFIAYILVDSSWTGVQALLLYSLAMASHLLLVDRSMAEQGYGLDENRGRWILALAVIASWSAGLRRYRSYSSLGSRGCLRPSDHEQPGGGIARRAEEASGILFWPPRYTLSCSSAF